MQEYLNKIMLSYGTTGEAVRAATGTLVSLLKSRATKDEMIALHHSLGGLTNLLKEAVAPDPAVVATPGRPVEVEQARKVLVADGLTPARVDQAIRLFGVHVRDKVEASLAAKLLAGVKDWGG